MKLMLKWLGLLTGPDVCKYDAHDYPVNKGGDGIPCHFYTYTCHMCGKQFTI